LKYIKNFYEVYLVKDTTKTNTVAQDFIIVSMGNTIDWFTKGDHAWNI
jgi:hypothetical protein